MEKSAHAIFTVRLATQEDSPNGLFFDLEQYVSFSWASLTFCVTDARDYFQTGECEYPDELDLTGLV